MGTWKHDNYPIGLCIHCNSRMINRPRRLCFRCYNTPGVREQYEMVTNANGCKGYGMTAYGVINGNYPLDSYATDARPGSEDKVAIMEERASKGLAIFHPGDLTALAEAGERNSRPRRGRLHTNAKLHKREKYED